MRNPNLEHSSKKSQVGMTLIELMVALAITAGMVALIAVIAQRAQDVYSGTVDRVKTVQRVRLVFDDVRSRLQAGVATDSLEFFVDRSSPGGGEENGRWEQGEEIRGPFEQENLIGGRPGVYDEGSHIIERYYELEDDPTEARYANFSIYFKAPVAVDGVTRLVNVEYFLSDPEARAEEVSRGELPLGKVPSSIKDNRYLELVRAETYIDIAIENIQTAEVPVRRKLTVVCPNVTDLKFEYLMSPLNGSPQFLTPSTEQSLFGGRSGVQELADGGLLKEFLYGGFNTQPVRRGTLFQAQRTAARAVNEPVYFKVEQENFAELGIGDKMYLWPEGNRRQLRQNGEYTIRRKEPEKLFFVEFIDSSDWGQNAAGIRYRAGYLPNQVKLTLRVLNDRLTEGRSYPCNIQLLHKKPD